MSDLTQCDEADYGLDVGHTGADRLTLIQDIYGATSKQWILDSGLKPGAHLLELGCGVGSMTSWLANCVTPSGRITAIDSSADQIHEAQKRCAQHQNIQFTVASALDTGLPVQSFDMIYFRLLLMHVPESMDLLLHAKSLLKPGGLLVCEEAAIDSTFTDPKVPEQLILHEIANKMSQERGCDYNIARRLGSLLMEAGYSDVKASAYVPIYREGIHKSLEVSSFREAVSHFKLDDATLKKSNNVCDVLQKVANDTATLYGLSTMMRFAAVNQ